MKSLEGRLDRAGLGQPAVVMPTAVEDLGQKVGMCDYVERVKRARAI